MADMHTPLPVIIDVTKKTFAAFGTGQHVIWDARGNVFALCPIFAEPVCEGQYSYAPLVQTAVNERPALLARASQDAETIKALEARLSLRDTFICEKGLWHEFASTVLPSASLSASQKEHA